jgi:hypothetical protein
MNNGLFYVLGGRNDSQSINPHVTKQIHLINTNTEHVYVTDYVINFAAQGGATCYVPNKRLWIFGGNDNLNNKVNIIQRSNLLPTLFPTSSPSQNPLSIDLCFNFFLT